MEGNIFEQDPFQKKVWSIKEAYSKHFIIFKIIIYLAWYDL